MKKAKISSYIRALIGAIVLFKSANDKRDNLIIDHRSGGGASFYLNKRLLQTDFKECNNYIVRPTKYKEIVSVNHNEKELLLFKSFFLKWIENNIWNKVFINELYGYDFLTEFQNVLIKISKNTDTTMTYCLHDYYCLCPSLQLFIEGRYCNMECNSCHKYGHIIVEWRKEWGNLLECCDDIIAFSEDTERRVSGIYKDIKIITKPHLSLGPLRNVVKKENNKLKYHVGLVGMLSPIKGLEFVRELVKYVEEKDLPYEFFHFGMTYDGGNIEGSIYTDCGAYSREKLPELIERYDIDFVFFSTVVPETFSYTCLELREMSIPFATFKLGAQADHAREYEKGWIIDDFSVKTTVEVFDKIVEKSR